MTDSPTRRTDSRAELVAWPDCHPDVLPIAAQSLLRDMSRAAFEAWNERFFGGSLPVRDPTFRADSFVRADDGSVSLSLSLVVTLGGPKEGSG